MKISQTLPRPDNWQDFETLCKKLWGEIWNYPEIKKNGRSGQDQAGIDVYGIPNGEKLYFGIQCKGKDEYTNKQLTKKEIDVEIGKALNFTPKLKKMYFATTAVKDAKIEAYIRQKNIEHIEKGIFEVHLYAWEEIVELIQENKVTYDYYLNSKSFKTNDSVKVTFKNGSEEMTVNPKFLKTIRVAKSKREELERRAAENSSAWMDSIAHLASQQHSWAKQQNSIARMVPSRPSKEYNRSLFDCAILVTNDGASPIENWKLSLFLPEQIIDYQTENFKSKNSFAVLISGGKRRDTFYIKNDHTIILRPDRVLVGDDTFPSDLFFLKTTYNQTSIEIPWKLVSKNFKIEGVLKLNIVPEWEIETIKVPDDSHLLLDENKRITIEDYIESIEVE
ncbi:hypothetical protein R5N98_12495 [Tenacibaculum maritimum]|uniref:restriction endonuclease n=1 Tax=Tenacibaculum maritimum TaxID=107401 RepID=UPI00388D52FD